MIIATYGPQGIQGYYYPVLRIRDPMPRVTSHDEYACLASLRIEGCLNSTIEVRIWNGCSTPADSFFEV